MNCPVEQLATSHGARPMCIIHKTKYTWISWKKLTRSLRLRVPWWLEMLVGPFNVNPISVVYQICCWPSRTPLWLTIAVSIRVWDTRALNKIKSFPLSRPMGILNSCVIAFMPSKHVTFARPCIVTRNGVMRLPQKPHRRRRGWRYTVPHNPPKQDGSSYRLALRHCQIWSFRNRTRDPWLWKMWPWRFHFQSKLDRRRGSLSTWEALSTTRPGKWRGGRWAKWTLRKRQVFLAHLPCWWTAMKTEILHLHPTYPYFGKFLWLPFQVCLSLVFPWHAKRIDPTKESASKYNGTALSIILELSLTIFSELPAFVTVLPSRVCSKYGVIKHKFYDYDMKKTLPSSYVVVPYIHCPIQSFSYTLYGRLNYL